METKNLELTKEMKEKLSGFLAITPENKFRYIPKFFRDNKISKDLTPIFTLKILDGLQLAEIEDNSGYWIYEGTRSEFHGMSGTHRIIILKKGIVGWENFRDSEGKIIEYKNENSIKILPMELQKDLVNAIIEQLTLTEDEARSLE